MAANNIERIALRRKSEFDQLKKAGRRLSPCPWLLLNYQTNNSRQLRFGISISAKVGNAVVRNRFKRWIREFMRNTDFPEIGKLNKLHQQSPNGMDVNVIFKPGKADFYTQLQHAEVNARLTEFFKKIKWF